MIAVLNKYDTSPSGTAVSSVAPPGLKNVRLFFFNHTIIPDGIPKHVI